jgi:basic membrane protein A
MRRRVIPLALGLSLLGVACGSSNNTTTSGSAAPSSSGGAAAAKPKVRVMTISPINVGTWDPQQHKAYAKAAQDQSWDLDIAQAVSYGQAPQVLDQWGQQGVDVVFATDSGFGDTVLKAAAKWPKTVFVVMSSLASTNNLPNIASYSAAYCEMGYMAGVLGATASKAGKVGVVSGDPVPGVLQFFNGLEQGISATSSSAKGTIQYSGDWVDPVKKATVARSLISNGNDVLMSFDTAPTATDQAIQSLGKKIIGIFADESSFAPNAVITSVIINWKGYAETVQAVMNHSFKSGIHVGGFKDGMIDLTTFAAGSSDLQAKADAAKQALTSGSVKLTGNCNTATNG